MQQGSGGGECVPVQTSGLPCHMAHERSIWPACRWHCLAMQRHAGALAKLLASVLFAAFLIDACGAAEFPKRCSKQSKPTAVFVAAGQRAAFQAACRPKGRRSPGSPRNVCPRRPGKVAGNCFSAGSPCARYPYRHRCDPPDLPHRSVREIPKNCPARSARYWRPARGSRSSRGNPRT